MSVKLWGVGGDENKPHAPFFAHAAEFATPAEAEAFKKGLAAAKTGQWYGFTAHDTQDAAVAKAAELNGPNFE